MAEWYVRNEGLLFPSKPRAMLLGVSVLAVMFFNAVFGQPTLITPDVAKCGVDAILTCLQTGFNSRTGHRWKKNGTPIVNSGFDMSRTGRYSETSAANSFSLVIASAVVDDESDYVCSYEFQESNPETLKFECQADPNSLQAVLEDNKVHIVLRKIFPKAPNITVECNEGEITGNIQSSTRNQNDSTLYDVTWLSGELLERYHACNLSVTYVTSRTYSLGINLIEYLHPQNAPRSTMVYLVGIGIAVIAVIAIIVVIVVIVLRKKRIKAVTSQWEPKESSRRKRTDGSEHERLISDENVKVHHLLQRYLKLKGFSSTEPYQYWSACDIVQDLKQVVIGSLLVISTKRLFLFEVIGDLERSGSILQIHKRIERISCHEYGRAGPNSDLLEEIEFKTAAEEPLDLLG